MKEAHIIGTSYFHVFKKDTILEEFECSKSEYDSFLLGNKPVTPTCCDFCSSTRYTHIYSFTRPKLDTLSGWLEDGYYFAQKDEYITSKNDQIIYFTKTWQIK